MEPSRKQVATFLALIIVALVLMIALVARSADAQPISTSVVLVATNGSGVAFAQEFGAPYGCESACKFLSEQTSGSLRCKCVPGGPTRFACTERQ